MKTREPDNIDENVDFPARCFVTISRHNFSFSSFFLFLCQREPISRFEDSTTGINFRIIHGRLQKGKWLKIDFRRFSHILLKSAPARVEKLLTSGNETQQNGRINITGRRKLATVNSV